MGLENKKIAMVVANDGFRDPEAFEPKEVLEKAGAEVKIIALEGGAAQGDDGGFLPVDETVGQANVDDYDAVIFIGGPGMTGLVDNQELIEFASKFNEADKVTTAICVAPKILANAGVLSGKTATSWEGVMEDLSNSGAEVLEQDVVVDGKVITACGPKGAKAFGEAIVEALEK
ncbi:DJ-1/PfpI family protein [Patescibacteria group bacterium]|nr:DJ-1/PfpI family protein [Patescibacteria group bacterium]MBU1672974.1 DJ-1/PfpI family protein [Patescibacteria group bacterium]MBU1962991.1 DJ-1/PfpI family protein [Patescibacteria group bacterium]